MGVDVDAGSFRLLQQVFEHAQIVAGDEDRFPRLGAEIDRGRHRNGLGDVVYLSINYSFNRPLNNFPGSPPGKSIHFPSGVGWFTASEKGRSKGRAGVASC